MNQAQKYFCKDLSSYFMWADRGRELCWSNGTTIAFHEEISSVLDRLVDQSFPDFSTLALCLATLRSSWPEVAAQLTHVVTLLKLSPNPSIRREADSRTEVLNAWPESLRKLELLTRYTEVCSPSMLQRAELVALVLGDFSSNFAAEAQQEIAAAFRSGLPEDWLTEKERSSDVDSLLLPVSVHDAYRLSDSAETRGIAVPRILRMIRIVKSLAASIPCETVEQLQQLLKTGIADDIKPVDEELLDQRALSRGLLEELADDEELSGFARLTKQLIAAITLPRTLSEPDDLQMGGISDITNRGSLDKLLLSELAHDDLTLAVRLAMNEALYMRRESPPVPQARTRSVLIDLSLPMWGIPRLFATAAALALHATSDRQTRINCFRSSLIAMKPSMLLTREGLQEHLAALEPTAHPGSSLATFFQAIGEESQAAEPVLITTSDVLENAEFRQTLDKLCPGDLWLVVVERDGRLKVLQRTRQGTSVRKQLQLPLEEILSRRTAEKIVRKDLPDELPAIFHLAKFPLLLSHQTRVGRFWKWGETAIALTDDGRLMHWRKKGLGARQLATGLAGRSDAKAIVVQQRPGELFQLLICPDNSTTGTLLTVSGIDCNVTLSLADYRIRCVSDVVLTQSALLVFGKQYEHAGSEQGKSQHGPEVCSAIMENSGKFLGTHSLDDVSFRVGRCFMVGPANSRTPSILSWVGGQVQWIRQKLTARCREFTQVVEVWTGVYLGLNVHGQLVDPENSARFVALNESLKARQNLLPLWFDAVSSDHELLTLAVLDRHQVAKADANPVDLPKRSSHFVIIALRSAELLLNDSSMRYKSPLAQFEFDHSIDLARQRTPHYRFSRIGADAGQLLLKDAGGGLFRVGWDSKDREIRLESVSELAASTQFVEFFETPVAFSQTGSSSNQPAGLRDQARTFSVKLTDVGANIIAVVKIIRSATNVGLKDAKDLVELAPNAIISGLSQEAANSLSADISGAGGTCEILPSSQDEDIASGSSFALYMAEWNNGSKAWLDTRGLLHLKSANRANLEMTLVMRDGRLSGWLSSGEVFGDTYYYGDDLTAQGLRRVTANVAWNLAIRPFIESVPWNFNFSSDTAQAERVV